MQKWITNIAALRAGCPLGIFLPGFLLGQLTAAFVSPWLGCAGGMFFLAACALLGKFRAALPWTLCLSLAAGILTALPSQIAPRLPNLSADKSYLVRVAGEPQYYAPGGVEVGLSLLQEISDQYREYYFNKPQALCKAVSLPWRNMGVVRQGEFYVIKAEFTPLWEDKAVFGWKASKRRAGYDFTCKLLYASKPLAYAPSKLSALRADIKKVVFKALGDSERAGLLLAAALGYRNLISEHTERAFKTMGLAHLLVASGYQVSLVFMSFAACLRFLLYRSRVLTGAVLLPQLIAVLALLAGIFFALICGMESSALRASMALLLLVCGKFMSRKTSLVKTISGSLLLLCAWYPCAFLEPGVQLTYAALFGICMGGADGPRLWVYLKACFYATYFTSIVSAFWFQNVPLLGFLLNPVVAPVFSLVGCNLGILTIICACVGMDPQNWGLRSASWILMTISAWVLSLATGPGARIERLISPLAYCACAGALATMLIARRLRKLICSQ